MTDTMKRPRPDAGRDTFNLAEFPLALMTYQQPRTRKAGALVYFARGGGKVTVTGSETYGLPTATDLDVLMAMMWLTKARNGFTNRQVFFTKHELVSMMRWDNNGDAYTRLVDSLLRWLGVTVHFKDSWFDASTHVRSDRMFGIIDDAYLQDCGPARGQGTPSSWWKWNETFFAECEAGGLKKLDVETYFGLDLPTTKRLYRFLDKRLFREATLTMDLRELAFEHVGLSRGYKTPAKLREKLRPALAELERIGFLKPAVFFTDDRGSPQIRLERAAAGSGPAAPTSAPATEPVGLAAELIAFGVWPGVVEELVATRSEADIRRAMAEARKKRKNRIEDPAAFLVGFLKKNPILPAPALPLPPSPSPALRVIQPDEPDPVRAMLRKIEADPDRLREFTAAAIANADPADREAYAKFPADRESCNRLPVGQALQRVALLDKIREDHARRLLDQAEGRGGDPAARSADPPAGDEDKAGRKQSRRRK